MKLRILIWLNLFFVVLFFLNLLFGIYKVYTKLNFKFRKYECVVCEITERAEAEVGLQKHYTYCCNYPELNSKEYFLGTEGRDLKLHSKASIFISKNEEDVYGGENIMVYYFMQTFRYIIITILNSIFIFYVIKTLNKKIKSDKAGDSKTLIDNPSLADS